MKYLFWICWAIELATALVWIGSEIKLQYISLNPYPFVAALYLMVVLAVRIGFDAQKTSVLLVTMPAIPLLAVGFIFAFPTERDKPKMNVT